MIVETAEEKKNADRQFGFPLVTIERVQRLQLAARIDEQGNNNVSKQPLGDNIKAYLTEESTENQLKTYHTNKFRDDGIVLRKKNTDCTAG